MKNTETRIQELVTDWLTNPRWNGIERPYSAEEVVKLQGSYQIEHSVARIGANNLWNKLNTQDFVAGLGALTGNQAIQEVEAGLDAIYLSGWQVAADANVAGEMYPDQSLYPANSVPAYPDYVKSFQVVQNGTTVEVQGTLVTGVTLRNDKDKTSEMVRGKINMKADRYSGAQYVNIYAHNGTVGIWKEVEITSSGNFATRYLNTNQIKAVILWSTTGNGVLLEMNE